MTRKLRLTLATTLMLAVAGMIGPVSKSAAGPAQKLSETATDISAAAKKGPGGGDGARNAGRGGGGNVRGPSIQRNAGQRNVGQRNVGQRNVGQRNVGQRNVGQRSIQRNVGQRNVGQRNVGQRNVGRANIGQVKTGQGNVRRGNVRRNAGQSGRGLSAVSIRGANNARVAGRNFSIWRGSHRVRHGGNWRTFVGLSTLGAVMFGTSYYYPYAYIDAPAPYCEGLTEDGCQLQWREVPTLEGPQDFQCVAYCPWQ